MAVYLQEKAIPPAIAADQNQCQVRVSWNRQKHQSIAVVAATSGSSMVASAPCASRLGDSANSQAASAIALGPQHWRLQAAVMPSAASQIHSEPSRIRG